MKSFRQKQEEKSARLRAERAEQARLEEEARKNKYFEENWGEDALKFKEEQHQQVLLENAMRRADEYEKLKQERLLKEQEAEKLRQEQADTGLGIGHERTWQLSWQSFSKHPKIVNLPMSEKIRLFKIAQAKVNQSIIQQPVLGSSEEVINYALQFTGDTGATARADLVATNFNPNDPTNKGFAEGSGRIPLAKSGFTISYWYRPDEHTGDAFAMGWKYSGSSRFSFGMRNAARPFFGIGSNSFGTYGGHNSWVTMTQNSGFIDNYNIDDYLDGDSNLKLNKWYHIAITYVGSEPGGVANNETDRIRRIYLDGYQIYGQKDEAIGTDYNDWHNVDRRGEINWTANLDEEMTRGFSFGMRCLKGSGATDGVDNAKYNNGHACGLDDVAIYNELKDNDWVRSVYNGGTDYNHKDSGGDGLVAYWKFNEGDGTTVKDLGPYGYHGTLTNAAVGEGDDITVQDAIRSISSGVPTWNELGSYE